MASYLVMMGLSACISPLAVCLTSIAASFPDLTPARLGFLSTATLLGVVVAMLAAGPLADKWGLRRFMLLGAGMQVAGLLCMGLSPSAGVLLGLTAFVGLGTGAVDALASPLVAGLQPENRTRAMNFLHACFPLGSLVMILGSSALLSATGNWRVVFPVMALPMLLGLGLYAATPFPPHEVEGEAPGALGKSGAFWVAFAGIFLAGATELGVTHWMPAYVERVIGWPRAAGAQVLLGFAVGMLIGRLSTGALAHWLKPLPLLMTAAGVCLACLLIGSQATGMASAAALGLLGLGVAGMWPTLLAYASDRVPGGGATMFSLLAAVGNLGGALSPSVIGVVTGLASLRAGYTAVVVFPLMALALFAWWRHKNEQGQRRDSHDQ